MKNNKIEDIKVKRIIHSIGLNNNLTDDQVKEIVEAQFRFAYETIRKLSFNDLTDDEIDNLKTNFYFKYIGKLYTDSEIIKKKKIQEAYKAKIINQKKEDGRQREFELGRCSED